MSIEPNTSPAGQSCNTCRFASTHTCAEDQRDRTVVICRRYPPIRAVSAAEYGHRTRPRDRQGVTFWPYTSVDDWCGEWRGRVSDSAKAGA